MVETFDPLPPKVTLRAVPRRSIEDCANEMLSRATHPTFDNTVPFTMAQDLMFYVDQLLTRVENLEKANSKLFHMAYLTIPVPKWLRKFR